MQLHEIPKAGRHGRAELVSRQAKVRRVCELVNEGGDAAGEVVVGQDECVHLLQLLDGFRHGAAKLVVAQVQVR